MNKLLTVLLSCLGLSVQAANPDYSLSRPLTNGSPLIGLGGGRMGATNPAAFRALIGISTNGGDVFLAADNVFAAGTSNRFDTLTGSNIWDKSNVKFWGAVGDGVTDDTAAFTNTIRSGTSIFIPKGRYRITKSVEFCYRTNMTISGEGWDSLILNEVSNSPAWDFTGCRGTTIRDLAFDTQSNAPSCAILIARPNNASDAPFLRMDRVFIDGDYTRAAVYTIASELNLFKQCYFSCRTSGGNAHALVYSAQTSNSIFGAVSSLYSPLTSDGTGGNGFNAWENCIFFYSSGGGGHPASRNLVLEFGQAHSIKDTYFYSNDQTNSVEIRNSIEGLDISSVRMERGAVTPIGFYFSTAHDFRDVTIKNSDIDAILGVTGSTFSDWNIHATYFSETNLGQGNIMLDAATLRDSDLRFGDTTAPAGRSTTNVQVRVRTASRGNTIVGLSATTNLVMGGTQVNDVTRFTSSVTVNQARNITFGAGLGVPIQPYDGIVANADGAAQVSALASVAGVEIGMFASVNGNGYFGTWTSNDLQLRVNNSDVATIKVGGNFGIGTNAPGTIFEAAGVIKGSGFQIGAAAIDSWDDVTNYFPWPTNFDVLNVGTLNLTNRIKPDLLAPTNGIPTDGTYSLHMLGDTNVWLLDASGGSGGSATNAVVGIQTNGTAVLATGVTNVNFQATTSQTVTGGVANGTVTIGVPTDTGGGGGATGMVTNQFTTNVVGNGIVGSVQFSNGVSIGPTALRGTNMGQFSIANGVVSVEVGTNGALYTAAITNSGNIKTATLAVTGDATITGNVAGSGNMRAGTTGIHHWTAGPIISAISGGHVHFTDVNGTGFNFLTFGAGYLSATSYLNTNWPAFKFSGTNSSAYGNPLLTIQGGTNSSKAVDVVVTGSLTATGGLSGATLTTTGNVTVGGKITAYNGDTLWPSGHGIPTIVGLTQQSFTGAASGTNTLFTAPSNGLYSVQIYLTTTSVATSGTLDATIYWTDLGAERSISPASQLNVGLAGFSQGSAFLVVTNGNAIKLGYTTGALVGSPTCKIDAVLTRLQ